MGKIPYPALSLHADCLLAAAAGCCSTEFVQCKTEGQGLNPGSLGGPLGQQTHHLPFSRRHLASHHHIELLMGLREISQYNAWL